MNGTYALKESPRTWAISICAVAICPSSTFEIETFAHWTSAGANLDHAQLAGAELADACLHEARLSGAECLGANLTGADLSGAIAPGCGFGRANLESADLSGADLSDTSLSHGSLRGARFVGARLSAARLVSADLRDCDFNRADIRGADLSESDVAGASFLGANLQEAALADVHGFEDANWAEVDIRNADFRRAHLLRRFILDENYLHEFRTRSRSSALLYHLWKITSDCGRSLSRWALSIVVLVTLFAGLYTFCAIDYGARDTWLAPFYFSVVTLTTLGYGDIVPSSAAAQALVITEVFLGYVGLGGLLAIFSNKLARRAD